MTSPTVIVVLGMHRSGTSAITRALLELGVSLGTNLMPGSHVNPKGYWEDMEIYALNERLLEALGHRWHSIAPIDPSAWQRPEISQLRLEALAVVRDRLTASPLWGFKDPRTVRLLPFWKSVLSHAGTDVRYLIASRGPISVAKSLAQRDGFAAEKSYLLWLQHVVPAIRDTVDAPRVVVDYDNLLASPERELHRISSALALQPPGAAQLQMSEYVRAFIDAGLRHSVFLCEDLALDPRATQLVRETNDLLQALARDEKHLSDPAVIETVGQISDTLGTFGTFTAYLERRERDLESVQAQLADDHEASERVKAQLESVHGQFADEHEASPRLKAQLDAELDRSTHLVKSMADLDSKVGILETKVLERDVQITSLNWQLKEAQSKLAAVLRSTSWRITLPLREAHRWLTAPKTQSKRYAKAALRRPMRTYQPLPLPAQTKALQRNWVKRPAPRVQVANSPKHGDVVSPTSDSPVVSVIVHVSGKIDHTLRCLKSIESHPPRLPFEVIVVDDYSSADCAELLSKLSGVRLVANTEEPGFIQSCNAGARVARGDYLVFLNSNTDATSDWVEKRLPAFEDIPVEAGVKIAAVTMVYNEALILPYFLRHYNYLDEIHVLYETDSTDESLAILMQAPNVVIERGHIEGGLDDIEKINLINKSVQRTKADWVYVVDPDEFIFPPNHESPHSFLKRQSCDVVRSGMYQVYRHRSDRELDPSLPPIPQRAHGDPDLFSTDEEANRASNNLYVKPNVVRPSKRLRFLPGHHLIEGDPRTSPELFVGAHWQMADPAIAVARRMERKARISERNRAHRMGWQHFDVTLEKIKQECEDHLDDPVIDQLSSFREPAIQDSQSVARSSNLPQNSVADLKGPSSPSVVNPDRIYCKGGGVARFDPLKHPICLSSPRRNVPFHTWRQHTPFAMLLIDLLKPRTLVELGVHYGDSYCAFCQAVAELGLGTSCYGVDTWEGDPHASFYGPEVLADLTAHHDPLYGGFSRLIRSTFDAAVQHFPDRAIDILHIDGYHTYRAVKHDFDTWLPKLSSNGVILFHDTNEKQRDFGVWKLWDTLKVRYRHFEFLHSHGLGLVAVGEEPPDELNWLFEANHEEAAAIRQFFFCLGDRLTLSARQESGTSGGGAELDALRAARRELEAIRSSTTWRIAKKLHVLIKAVRSPGSRGTQA